MKEDLRKPVRAAVMVDLWSCEQLKKLMSEQIRVVVKDVELARKLEHALGDQVAYGDGGGDPVAIT